MKKVAVIGGGAAGFFAALASKENDPTARVVLMERGNRCLSKVKISGGGRCNVTNACFDPKELVKNYPRGTKELLGPFHRFGPEDTIRWFKERGVELKTEADGRIFPVSDSSETIISCFFKELKRLGVELVTQARIDRIQAVENGIAVGDEVFDKVIVATGSNKAVWELLRGLGHTIVEPVPSLFTFNIPKHPLKGLAGLSTHARLKIFGMETEGPLLITHWGFSGPAALRLSAFAARKLAEKNYEGELLIDYLPRCSNGEFRTLFQSKKRVANLDTPLPRKLWEVLCHYPEKPADSLSETTIDKLYQTMRGSKYQILGKTTNKDEFVTAGGVCLKEVNFKTMESKLVPHLHFAGEVLNIDGVTGGFNFQNAWTSAWIAAELN